MKAINQLHLQFLNQILYDYKIENEYCVWLLNYLKDCNRPTFFNEIQEEGMVIYVRNQFQLRLIDGDSIIYNQQEIFNQVIHSKLPVILIFENFLKNHRKLLLINFISILENAIHQPNEDMLEQITSFPLEDIQKQILYLEEFNILKNELHIKIDASLDHHQYDLFMYYSKLSNKLLEVQNDI
ncbi:hypothetical protein [Macrococcus sp. DPC7161]|uniref:hypothetical protein n=1 Tax=Macrococcus sp. DPC7161 TaxID=2507060 RepID=UPI00100A526E|nr:hypothetical protein [Macrococcus sp. DPC7161]RXK19274.1 hypothetical protein ER639_02855 [Macrococcus sp. DPC7161]